MALNVRRFGNKPRRVHPRGGKGFNILQPRDWRGRWITSRGVHTNSEGKKVEGALGSARAYRLYAVNKSAARGAGFTGLKKNTVPYARISTGGTTVGVNAGTIIPGTGRRVVGGGYFKIEHVSQYKRQKVASDILLTRQLVKMGMRKGVGGQNGLGPVATKYMSRAEKSAMRAGPKAASDLLAGHRMDIAGGKAQVRFTSTRKYNPTLTIRRGRHKVSPNLSQKGTVTFNKHIEALNRKRDRTYKPRPQRRKAAKKRVR